MDCLPTLSRPNKTEYPTLKSPACSKPQQLDRGILIAGAFVRCQEDMRTIAPASAAITFPAPRSLAAVRRVSARIERIPANPRVHPESRHRCRFPGLGDQKRRGLMARYEPPSLRYGLAGITSRLAATRFGLRCPGSCAFHKPVLQKNR